MTVDLAELILATKGDRTFYDLARASERAGNYVSAERWAQLAGTRRKIESFPRKPTILTLAEVLGVPVATVVNACARSLDLPVPPASPRAEILTPMLEHLSDAEFSAVLAVVRAMRSNTGSGVHLQMPDADSADVTHEPPADQRTPSNGKRRS